MRRAVPSSIQIDAISIDIGVGIHAVGRAEAQAGERAIVIGAGPIGLSVIEFLRLAGADFGVVEKMPERLNFAARHYGIRRYFPSHQEARQFSIAEPPVRIACVASAWTRNSGSAAGSLERTTCGSASTLPRSS